ncbi:hypothetical protein SAMN06298216_1579 [Spirosomataceae bacterium TFI 002]|nr:hypothetical protein SAMN06298216_1579 [Spirosomataceae bacterium TFI 002]
MERNNLIHVGYCVFYNAMFFGLLKQRSSSSEFDYNMHTFLYVCLYFIITTPIYIYLRLAFKTNLNVWPDLALLVFSTPLSLVVLQIIGALLELFFSIFPHL